MARTGATQQFVQVEDVKNGVVYLKDGSLRAILMVNGINFDLKSETEQNTILHGFQEFLNGLDFSVQLFIHSRKLNIKPYLERIEERRAQEKNELLKTQIEEYIEFVRTFVEQNPIISKRFFVIVPYDTVQAIHKAKGFLSGFIGKKKGEEVVSGAEQSTQQLQHRVEEVTSNLEAIGLRVTPLQDEEIVELYYNLYNPEIVEKRGREIPKIEESVTGNR